MRTMTRILCGGLLGAGLSLLILQPSASNAQNAGGTGGAKSAMVEAKKRITDLQTEVNELKAEQKKMRDATRAEFEEKDEWKDTVGNHKKAKAAYEQAKKKALAQTKAQADYKQIAKDRDALKVKLDELGAKASASPDEITTFGTQLSEKAVALKKMEAAALKDDEKTLDAKDALDAATKAMAALNEEVEDALYADPEYEALRDKIEQAETQLATAREQLAQQRKSAQASRGGKGGAGGGGPGGMGGSGMGKGAMKGMKGKGR